MRRTTWLCWICVWALGCGEAAGTSAVGDVSAPVPERPSAFVVEGVPAPWWRKGAGRTDFEVDLRTCRDRSAAARKSASEDPPDAAYRAFLTCMGELAWTRGAPPRRAGTVPG